MSANVVNAILPIDVAPRAETLATQSVNAGRTEPYAATESVAGDGPELMLNTLIQQLTSLSGTDPARFQVVAARILSELSDEPGSGSGMSASMLRRIVEMLDRTQTAELQRRDEEVQASEEETSEPAGTQALPGTAEEGDPAEAVGRVVAPQEGGEATGARDGEAASAQKAANRTANDAPAVGATRTERTGPTHVGGTHGAGRGHATGHVPGASRGTHVGGAAHTGHVGGTGLAGGRAAAPLPSGGAAPVGGSGGSAGKG